MKSKLTLILKYWFPVFCWAGLIFYLSHLPGEEFPEWGIPYLDKVVHAFEFGVLGFLLCRSFKNSFSFKYSSYVGFVAFIVSFFYAVSDEIHQHWISGRVSSCADLIADGIGMVVFIVLYLRFVKK